MAAAPLPPLSVPLPCPTPAHREESLPASPPREVPPIGGAPVSPGGHDSDDDEPPVLHPPAPEPRPTHHQPHHHIVWLHYCHHDQAAAGRGAAFTLLMTHESTPAGTLRLRCIPARPYHHSPHTLERPPHAGLFPASRPGQMATQCVAWRPQGVAAATPPRAPRPQTTATAHTSQSAPHMLAASLLHRQARWLLRVWRLPHPRGLPAPRPLPVPQPRGAVPQQHQSSLLPQPPVEPRWGAPRQPHRVAQSMLPAPPPPPLHCPTPRPLEPPVLPTPCYRVTRSLLPSPRGAAHHPQTAVPPRSGAAHHPAAPHATPRAIPIPGGLRSPCRSPSPLGEVYPYERRGWGCAAREWEALTTTITAPRQSREIGRARAMGTLPLRQYLMTTSGS
ncbi:uncharacterized protein LOC135107741 isoform X2 [Scylla paramamosain]|uniref:uncharacterized protein LOC135107741 isoform X2 n=1 Tax=Scylla paramamosain TaxID=85552 RepID=UPI0030832E27